MRTEGLKRRIKVVAETQKVVSAMQMIASSKMRKETDALNSSSRYAKGVFDIVESLMTEKFSYDIYFCKSKEEKIAYLLLSGDSGLCGDYNLLVLNESQNDIQNKNIKTLFPIGRLGKDFHENANFEVDDRYVTMVAKPNEENAQQIASELIARFKKGEFDSIQIAYTDSTVLADHKIRCERLLPIPFKKTESPAELLFEFEGLDSLIELYLSSKIYEALCSASLAMNYKKLITMRQATSNSEEMLDELTKKYNQLRQEKITSEILDSAISQQGKKL